MAIVAVAALSHPKSTGATAGKTTKAPSPSASTSPVASSSSLSSSAAASSSAAPASSSASSPSASVDSATSTKQPLVVLNNTTTTGLAQEASNRFKAGGWDVTHYDNYQNDIISTCAYYDPTVAGAKAAAEALQQQFPTIKRVEPQFSELSTWNSPIVVILTPDYQE